MAGVARRRRMATRTRYVLAAMLLCLAVALLGIFLNQWMTRSAAMPMSSAAVRQTEGDELKPLFAAAVEQMQQGRYRHALDLWHRALLLAPELPEIKVNMGFSLYELGEYAIARDFFIEAMTQDAYQANAYYGLALTSEKMNDFEGAVGAMRSYIHLAGGKEDKKYLRLARAAIWEWEARIDERRQSSLPVDGKPED